MKLSKTIACTAAFLLTPALAWAEPAPPHDHSAAGQSQPAQSEPGKPQDMKCPMMQDMHGGMKMNGQAMPRGAGNGQDSTTGRGGMNGMGEMKCMQDGAAAKPTAPQPAPEGQHNHDHSGAGSPQ